MMPFVQEKITHLKIVHMSKPGTMIFMPITFHSFKNIYDYCQGKIDIYTLIF